MGIYDLNDKEAITAAVDEYNAIGAKSFLTKYGYSTPSSYFMIFDEIEYPLKAIIGSAHQYQFPEEGPLGSEQFNSEMADRRAKALGFETLQKNEGRTRRPSLNFASLGIPSGSILSYKDDSSIQCEVISDRRVRYQGESGSLSGVTTKINGTGKAAIWWVFEGETLWERTIRLYPESENTAQKRPAFNFGLLGILPGEALTFIDDETITCIVEGERLVRFQDENYYLSRLTAKIREQRDELTPSGQYDGAEHWLYENETIWARRARMEVALNLQDSFAQWRDGWVEYFKAGIYRKGLPIQELLQETLPRELSLINGISFLHWIIRGGCTC